MNANAKHETLQMSKYPLRIVEFINHYHDHILHWHEEIEILYMVKGEGIITCDMKDYYLKEGDILFVNGKEAHKGCEKGHNVVLYCIQVNTNFIHNLIGDEYVIFDNFIHDEECASWLDCIIAETPKCGFESKILMKKALCNFFWKLINDGHVNAVLSEDDYKKRFRRLDTFNSIIEYINENYDKDLSVQNLADHFFMSTSYFSHLFKKKSGKSVIEYINDIRIYHAKLFIEVEDTTIGSVASRVGFNDINYFSRKFKAITGLTPIEYKKSAVKSRALSEKNSES